MAIFLIAGVFIFYRVIFKLGYDVSIPIFANILICVGLGISVAILNYFIGLRFGSQLAAKRLGCDKPTLKTLNPFVALCIISIGFSVYCWLISFGFSESFFHETWDYADDAFEFSIVAFIFCIPLLAHYLISKRAMNIKIKQVEPS